MASDLVDRAAIEAAESQLREHVRKTPVVDLTRSALARSLDLASLKVKFEHMQHTGSFKARGALYNLLQADAEEVRHGVTAVSAGNHAIATAFAAHVFGVSAKVVLLPSASEWRREKCRSFGAELVIADSLTTAFEQAERLRLDEQRLFVHPYDSRPTLLGTASLGLEWSRQVSDTEVMIVPVGGGGLAGGVGAAAGLFLEHCEVIGVEPEGADSMSQSLKVGEPVRLDEVKTIADSLGAPGALAYSFAHCQQYLSDIVTVSDTEIRAAMMRQFVEFGLALEPACAAATAALLGPLAAKVRGRRVSFLFCGSNLSPSDWSNLANAA